MNKPKGPESQNSSGFNAATGNIKMLILALLAGASLNTSCSKEVDPKIGEVEKAVATLNQKLTASLETCNGLQRGEEELGASETAKSSGYSKDLQSVVEQALELKDVDNIPFLQKLQVLVSEGILPKMNSLNSCLSDFCFKNGINLCDVTNPIRKLIRDIEGLLENSQKDIEGLVACGTMNGEVGKFCKNNKKELEELLVRIHRNVFDIQRAMLKLQESGYEGEDLETLREKAKTQLRVIELLIKIIDGDQNSPSSSNGKA